jgi:glycosyltransferase involved in cell wall biosynthesis
MRKEFLISICIPIFNGEDTLRELIESILRNIANHENIEVVISDNKSTDKTIEIINEYSIPNLSLIILDQNKGFVSNIISCISSANGRYITFMGHDDILVSIDNMIEMSKWMSENDISLCSSDIDIFIGNEGNIINKAKFSRGTFIYDDSYFASIGEAWINSALASLGGWLVNRKSLLSIDLDSIPRESIYPEYYIGYKLIEKNYKIGGYETVYYSQRLTNNNHQLANLQYTSLKYFKDFYSLVDEFAKNISDEGTLKCFGNLVASNLVSLKSFGCSSKELFIFLFKQVGFKNLSFKHYPILFFVILLPSSILKFSLSIYRSTSKK